MANVRNILLEVVGRGDDAKQTLLELAQSVRDLPDRRRIEVEAQTAEAQRQIREMLAALKAVDRAKATPEVNVAITKAMVELERMDSELDDLDGRRVTAHVEVETRRDQIEKALAEATARFEAVGARQQAVTVQFDLKITEAEANLARIRAEIDALPAQRTVEIDAQARGLDEELARAEAKLAAFTAQRDERVLRFTAETSRAEANIARLAAAEAALPDRHEIDIEVNRSIIGDLAKVNSAMTGVARTIDSAIPSAQRFGQQMSEATFRASAGFLSFGGALGPIFAIVAALAVVVGVSLVAAVGALVASLATAVAAIGALGAALLAALGPAIGLAVAVATRLAKVTAALKAEDAAAQQVGSKAAGGSQAATAAAQAHEAAVTSLKDAQAALGRAGAQAYREMADAAEAASDAIRGIADAELNLDSSRLSIREAEAALRDYTDELGNVGKLSDDFKKFTDVSFDFDTSQLAGALQGVTFGDDAENKELRLERLILNVREARQREKNAVDAVSDAERNRSRTLETHNAFVRDGIAASQGYQAALRGVRDAQRQVNKAMQDPAPLTATTKAAFLVGELTDKERELLRAIKEVRRELRGAFRGATDAVFGGMIRMLRRVPQLVNPLRGAFTNLGRDIASALDIFGEELIRPEWISAIRQFIAAGGRIAQVFTRDIFVPFLRVVRDLALAALPHLERLLRRVGAAMQRLSGQTGPTRMRDVVAGLVRHLDSWLALAYQLGRVFINFIRAGNSEGRSFVDWITDGARRLADWLGTAKGRNTVAEFLRDAVEASKTFLENVGALTLAILQFVSEVSPPLTALFGLVNKLFGALAKVQHATGIFSLFGGELSGARSDADAAAAALDKLADAQERLTDSQRRGEDAIRDFMDARRDATRELSDMASAASSAQLDRRRARLDVRDAKKRRDALRDEGGSADDLERANIDLADARQRYRDVTRDAVRAVQDNNAAQDAGIKGTDVYQDALGRLKDALADTATEIRKVVVAQREASEPQTPDLSWWDQIKAKASDVAGSVSGTFSRLWQGIPSGLRTGIGNIAAILATRGAALPAVVARWGPRLLSAASEAAGNIATGIINNSEKIRGAVGSVITGAVAHVRDFFGSALGVGRALGEKIAAGVGTGLRTIVNVGRDILNGLIDLFNGAIELINNALPDKVTLKGLPDINLPDNPIGVKIPHLAGGGVVTGATTALLGEQTGVREAVLPLTRRIMRQLAAAITRQMSSFAVAPIIAGGGRGALSPSPAAAGGGPMFHDAVFKIEAPAGAYPDARTTMTHIEGLVARLGGDPNI